MRQNKLGQKIKEEQGKLLEQGYWIQDKTSPVREFLHSVDEPVDTRLINRRPAALPSAMYSYLFENYYSKRVEESAFLTTFYSFF